MKPDLTEKTIRQFVEEISDQHQPMTETVIAATATHAAALGEACMQISLDNQVDRLDWQDVTSRIEQMAHIKNTLLEWCNQQVSTPVNYVVTEELGEELVDNRQEVCDYSAEIGRFSVQAAIMLQDFRPLVFEPVRNDLEMTINLLAGVAKTAVMLLNSNLYKQPLDEPLKKEYEPLRDELLGQINQLKVRQITSSP